MWQGIRDWLRPVGADVVDSNRECPDGATLAREGLDHSEGTYPGAGPGPGSGGSGSGSLYGSGDVAVLDANLRASEEAEFLEFLASDLDPVPADPVFRERLREELWDLVVKEGVGTPPTSAGPLSSRSPARLRIVAPHEGGD